jgi:hypothetical protein
LTRHLRTLIGILTRAVRLARLGSGSDELEL